jgi:quinol monooxygenase YgiN
MRGYRAHPAVHGEHEAEAGNGQPTVSPARTQLKPDRRTAQVSRSAVREALRASSSSVPAMTIIVSVQLHVDAAERAAFLAARVPILAHARQAPGCLDFSLSADPVDLGRINVYERWSSHDDLLTYRAGDGPEREDRIAVTAADVELHHISASEAP